MELRTLESREDIEFLVRQFYQAVRQDELLGPIFNQQIMHWESHIQRLTDFWQTNLLVVRRYKGNPLRVHQEVDRQSEHSIQQVHFGRWLQHWFQTLDQYFIGENKEIAKNRARNMASHLFIKMYTARPEYRERNS